MKVETRLDPARNVRVHTATGKANGSDIINALREIYTSNYYTQRMNVLWDARKLDLEGIEPGGLQAVFDYTKVRWGTVKGTKMAFVVNGTKEHRVVADMFAYMAKRRMLSSTKVFTNIDDARAWLDE